MLLQFRLLYFIINKELLNSLLFSWIVSLENTKEGAKFIVLKLQVSLLVNSQGLKTEYFERISSLVIV